MGEQEAIDRLVAAICGMAADIHRLAEQAEAAASDLEQIREIMQNAAAWSQEGE